MKQFKDFINNISGLRYFFETLNIKSSYAKKVLMNQELFTDDKLLTQELENVNSINSFINKITAQELRKIKRHLCEIRDINLTIKNLKSGNTLDDIELFEIKHFTLASQNIYEIFVKNNFPFINEIHDLKIILNLLDPENTRISSFYIYSRYDNELLNLRNIEVFEKDAKKREDIRVKIIEIEDVIRKKLSAEIMSFTDKIYKNLHFLAYIDILIAKAELFTKFNLVMPKISKDITELDNFWNPEVESILSGNGKKFQKVNLKINNSPIIITGANMSGKTLILKTIAQIQYLFQFGFFVPAEKARLQIFEEIFLCVGDEQSELSGLSSFAGEMQNIDEIIKSVKAKKKTLALVDELARTTNPKEGIAIIKSFCSLMKKYSVPSLITTHYNIEIDKIEQLRVKGLKINSNEKVTIENIGDYMDYSLEKTDNKSNNHNDALKIAEILNIDSELINTAKEMI